MMPANCTGGWVRDLLAKYPAHIGHLLGPGGWRTPFPEYALDNGRYTATTKGEPWDEAAFWLVCDRAAAHAIPPRWVVVPDVVGDARATLTLWADWAPRLRATYPGWHLALAVQDGMTAEMVQTDADPELVFVGGSTAFKWSTLGHWVGHFARVHVGRVNAHKRLWECRRAGAESVDGTGFGRTTRQRNLLARFLGQMAAHDRNPDLPFDLFAIEGVA